MRAFLVLLLVAGLAVGGWLGYQRFLAPVEQRACASLAGRCGLDADTRGSCETVVREVGKASGDEAADRFASCLSGAKTCAEAAGCVTGLGTGLLSKNVLEFVNGLRRAH
jgi:hypothetical protein